MLAAVPAEGVVTPTERPSAPTVPAPRPDPAAAYTDIQTVGDGQWF